MDLLTVDLNWPVIIGVGICAIALIIFLIKRNVKDKKNFEQTINQVDKRPLDHDENNDSGS